ncbi:hypothetical protein BH10ACI1_BH10ACI1_19230 [soil metagenome]
MKKLSAFYFLLFTCAFGLATFGQTLTVRDIMREPSMAGMRPESEKLSPDGKYVIYSWNAEGREPRNLYIVSTSGGEPRILVNAEMNFEVRSSSKESNLNYGLIVRDDFEKAREKNLFGVEFSPDSKRILFLQNTDIYVLDLAEINISTNSDKELTQRRWATYESAMLQYANSIMALIEVIKKNKIQDADLFNKIEVARLKLSEAINEQPKGENGSRSDEQKQKILELNKPFQIGRRSVPKTNLTEVTSQNTNPKNLLDSFLDWVGEYPQLPSNEEYLESFDELQGKENRLNVARLDYNDAIRTTQNNPKPRRITRTQSFEGGARWLTNDSILYSSGGNYFVLDLKETSIIQVTKEANPAAFVSVFGANPTKDAKLLAFIVSDGSRQRTLFVPNYVDEFVQANSTRRGFTEQKVLVSKLDGTSEKPFEIKLPKAEGVGYIRGIDWAADNSSLIVDRIDKDLKRRQLFYIHDVGSKAEQTILVTEETDEKWIAPLSGIVEPNPKDSSQILFGSERDGFNHLYLATLERAKPPANPNNEIRQENPSDAGFTGKVEIDQITKGKWQVEWAKWLIIPIPIITGNISTVIFASTKNNPSERTLSVIGDSNNPQIKDLPLQKGMKNNFQLENNRLVFTGSKWNFPTELYAVDNKEAVKLTSTTSETFLKRKWNEPKFIDIPSRDGKIIKSKIYLPADFDKTKKYPMTIFVHGAGYLQNTINGWNNYYREFMFNQLLTEKGYVVLDIDYRGSAGYGRDWRTDVYDFLGGKDYEDHLDAIDFAVKNYAVDAKKIGVYGGSYGGFMAEMLAFRTDKITCAAALRPVADWKNYFISNPSYTAERLGFPDRNAEAYKRSSPISYADGLNKPLLILHGLVDSNVPAQDSLQLMEKLIRLEKTQYFEVMLYPSENHGFERPTSWTDEYERILSFFEKHLK